MGGDDLDRGGERVQAVDGGERGFAVGVEEQAGHGGLLAQQANLQVAPHRVTGQQHAGAVVDGEQHPDAARRVPGQVDQQHRAVAEQIPAAREAQHGRTVEFDGVEFAAEQRTPCHPQWRARAIHRPVPFDRGQPDRHRAGQLEQTGHVIPVQMGGDHEIHVVTGHSDGRERVGQAAHRLLRSHQQRHRERQFAQHPPLRLGAHRGVDEEPRAGMFHQERGVGHRHLAQAAYPLGHEDLRRRRACLGQCREPHLGPRGRGIGQGDAGEQRPVGATRTEQPRWGGRQGGAAAQHGGQRGSTHRPWREFGVGHGCHGRRSAPPRVGPPRHATAPVGSRRVAKGQRAQAKTPAGRAGGAA